MGSYEPSDGIVGTDLASMGATGGLTGSFMPVILTGPLGFDLALNRTPEPPAVMGTA